MFMQCFDSIKPTTNTTYVSQIQQEFIQTAKKRYGEHFLNCQGTGHKKLVEFFNGWLDFFADLGVNCKGALNSF